MPWWQQNLINARILRAADDGGGAGGSDGGGDGGGDKGDGDGGDKGGGDKGGGDKGGGAGGDKLPGWMHQLKAETREKLTPYGFKTPDDLASFALTQADNAGKLDKAIFVPGEGEDRTGFRKAWGVPEQPDAYDFGIKDLPPEYVDQNFAKFAGELFHGADIAGWQGQKLAAGWNKHMLDTVKASQKANADRRASEEAALASQLGGRMEEGIAVAKRVLSHFGVQGQGDEGVDAMLDAMSSVMGYDKAVVALGKMANTIAGSGASPNGGDGGKGFSLNDPATAKAAREKLKREKGDILGDVNHREHKAVMAQYDALLAAETGVKG